MLSRITRLLVLAICLANSKLAQADAGDLFIDALVIPPGLTFYDGELLYSSEVPAPDLYLGVYDSFSNLIDTNDNDSYQGDGFAPALNGVAFNLDGSYSFSITGASDTGFTGSHAESGAYQATVTIVDSAGDVQDQYFFDSYLEEGTVDSFYDLEFGSTYDVVINNTIPNDMDFIRFTGLTPGASFVAETTSFHLTPFDVVDTFIGWFDESGEVIETNDDKEDSFFSLLEGTVPANGEVVIAVSGYGDNSFEGYHGESGNYTLELYLTGDYDLDGDIDTNDYDQWVSTYGQVGDFLVADGNSDGVVDAADYTVWRDNLGVVLELQTIANSIPEPTTIGMLLIAIAMVHRRR